VAEGQRLQGAGDLPQSSAQIGATLNSAPFCCDVSFLGTTAAAEFARINAAVNRAEGACARERQSLLENWPRLRPHDAR